MTSMERTAYPCFRHPLSATELRDHFTPTEDEMTLATAKTRDPGARLTLLVLLKTTQRLGYVPRIAEIPLEIVAYLRWYLRYDERVTIGGPGRSLRRYVALIRMQMQIDGDPAHARAVATAAMSLAAQTMDHPPDIINAAIELLIKERCELPAFSMLDRLAGTIRTQVNDAWCEEVMHHLPPDVVATLTALFTASSPTGKSAFHQLKLLPKSATLAHLDEWLEHLAWLTAFGDMATWLDNLPVTKVRHMAAEARALDASEMQHYTLARRMTMTVCLIHDAHVKTQDALVTMFIKRMAAIHAQAHASLDALLLRQRATVESWVDALADISRATAEHQENQSLGEATREIIARFGGPDVLLEAYDALAKYHGNNYYPLLWQHFHSHRRAFFKVLEVLAIRSTSQDQAVVQAIAYLLANRSRRGRYTKPPFVLDFTTDQWRRTIQVRRKKTLWYDRRRLEVCLFTTIANEFKSGDLAIPYSEEYADLHEQLQPWDACIPQVAEYCQQLNLPSDSAGFVQQLRDELTAVASQVDARIPYLHGQVTITERGEIVLKRTAAPPPTKARQRLEAEIQARLPTRTVLEVLKNAHHYTGWTRHFGPRSGADPKVNDAATRYILLAFSSGCNLGPWQTAHHLRQAVTAHELSYTNQRHATAILIDRGMRDVVNVYAQCALPKLWGTGKTAAADGTKLELVRENLLSEYHIRYGGYGGIAYYHISDRYVALCSHFISCGTWEGIYILDGLLKNHSDLQPDTLHADTQGQTTTVFGMAHLLGIQLMPRIRHWKQLVFFRPEKHVTYQHIDALFTDTIDWELIQRHWQDLMQVVLSIKAGRVLASSILRKLNHESRKNRLYLAFRELGRVIRTLFLLRYISDKPLREQVTASTNQVESYNAFSQWLAFGNSGKIMDNDPVEMEKMVKFNQLVANCLMLQNVLDMSTIIRDLMREGFPVTMEAVQGLSPYLHAHIRRYGIYDVDLADIPPPITEVMLAPLFPQELSTEPVSVKQSPV